jgi:hypothetical protein
MHYAIESREGYLHAAVYGRDTGEDMREFILAVREACQRLRQRKILMPVRQSRALFKPEDYGLSAEGRGFLHDLVTPNCQVALLGDNDEVNAANEYIEVVARQQGVNLRAFRDERSALQWLRDPAAPSRRYRFTRIVIAGAPEDAGVFTLWDGEDVVYYGRAEGGDARAGIRSRLLDYYYEGASRPTHYSWEVCKDPAAREAELLKEHQLKFGRPPRNNGRAA